MSYFNGTKVIFISIKAKNQTTKLTKGPHVYELKMWIFSGDMSIQVLTKYTPKYSATFDSMLQFSTHTVQKLQRCSSMLRYMCLCHQLTRCHWTNSKNLQIEEHWKRCFYILNLEYNVILSYEQKLNRNAASPSVFPLWYKMQLIN